MELQHFKLSILVYSPNSRVPRFTSRTWSLWITLDLPGSRLYNRFSHERSPEVFTV